MYSPTKEQVEALAGQGNLVPVYREINADLETPVSAYLKIARPPYSFLLESVEGGERIARYSFIGTEPRRVLKTGPGQERVPPLRVIALESVLRLVVSRRPRLARDEARRLDPAPVASRFPREQGGGDEEVVPRELTLFAWPLFPVSTVTGAAR